MDEYRALDGDAERRLDSLVGEFDALLVRLQTQQARKAMEAAFGASPARLGKAALAATSKRGR